MRPHWPEEPVLGSIYVRRSPLAAALALLLALGLRPLFPQAVQAIEHGLAILQVGTLQGALQDLLRAVVVLGTAAEKPVLVHQPMYPHAQSGLSWTMASNFASAVSVSPSRQ